jgi:hypothetical protein
MTMLPRQATPQAPSDVGNRQNLAVMGALGGMDTRFANKIVRNAYVVKLKSVRRAHKLRPCRIEQRTCLEPLGWLSPIAWLRPLATFSTVPEKPRQRLW